VWIVKKWIAATMQQLVLMVEELKKFPAAAHDRFVIILIHETITIHCVLRKLEHNGTSVFNVEAHDAASFRFDRADSIKSACLYDHLAIVFPSATMSGQANMPCIAAAAR
jgi:hypothetical protein